MRSEALILSGILISLLYLFAIPIKIDLTVGEDPIFSAFGHKEQEIFICLICSITLAVPMALDLIVDYFLDSNGFPQTDLIERLFLLIYVVVTPGTVFYYLGNHLEMSISYSRAHMIQHIGYMSIICSYSVKLYPSYFANTRYCSSLFLIAIGCGMGLYTMNYESHRVYSIIAVIAFGIGNLIFSWHSIQWLYAVVYRPLIAEEPIPLPAVRLLPYITVALPTLIVVPAVVMIPAGYLWSQINSSSIMAFIIAYSSFNLLVGSIPGRLARYFVRHTRAIVEMRREMIRYFGHEIRSPLNVIKIGLSLINLDELTPETAEIVRDVLGECATAIILLNNLLDFEKLDSNKIELEQKIEPIEKIESIVRRCGLVSMQKNIAFTISNHLSEGKEEEEGGGGRRRSDEVDNDDDTRDCFSVDLFKVEQVIRNLVCNAVKFTPEGGAITVSLRTRAVVPEPQPPPQSSQHSVFYSLAAASTAQSAPIVPESSSPAAELGDTSLLVDDALPPGRYLQIDVTDNGVGISAENQKSVFKEFQQFEANSLQGGQGSGLGLWIARRLVEMHGGALRFHSDGIGHGTTFSVFLPMLASGSQSSNVHRSFKDEATTLKPISAVIDSLSNSSNATDQTKIGNLEGADSRGGGGGGGEVERDVEMGDRHSLEEVKNRSYHTGPPSSQLPFSSSPSTSPSPLSTVMGSRDECPSQLPASLTFLIVDDSSMNRKFTIRCIKRLLSSSSSSSSSSNSSSSFSSTAMPAATRQNVKLNFIEMDDGVPTVQFMFEYIAKGGRGRKPSLVMDDMEEGAVVGDGGNGSKERLFPAVQRIDAVFLDSLMIAMNGPEVASNLREMGYQGLIVGVTGNVMERDVQDFITAGADCVLAKPLELERLGEVLMNIGRESEGE